MLSSVLCVRYTVSLDCLLACVYVILCLEIAFGLVCTLYCDSGLSSVLCVHYTVSLDCPLSCVYVILCL
jgi:hypothetical protein